MNSAKIEDWKAATQNNIDTLNKLDTRKLVDILEVGKVFRQNSYMKSSKILHGMIYERKLGWSRKVSHRNQVLATLNYSPPSHGTEL